MDRLDRLEDIIKGLDNEDYNDIMKEIKEVTLNGIDKFYI